LRCTGWVKSHSDIWREDLGSGDVDYGPIAEYMHQQHLTAPLTLGLALENATKITRSVVEITLLI
jgi:hypothetical protein